MAKQAPAGEAAIGADRQIHRHRLLDKNALLAPLFRHQRQAARYRVRRVARSPRLAIQFAARQTTFAGAKQRLAQFGFAGARQSGDPQNLSLAQTQGDILQ